MNDKLSQYNQESNIQKDIYDSDMYKEINKTKEEALESTIAGLHVQPTTTQYKTETPENPYEVQREVLSKINLLDHDLNPTDTYTNYINNNNTPVPGYEQYHDTLLFLDRQQDKMNQVQEGTLTEEQMLWDLYGADILEAQGYNVRSVGWWQNKYYNNDFTSPFDNRYLTSLITDKAREYHQSLLAKKYANDTKVSQSKMSSLLSKGDLSNEDIKTLFPELAKSIEETQDSKDYQRFITSGQTSDASRIHTTSGGDRYYLHTDGELYRLSNTETGSKIASFQENEDGSLREISINGSDVLDAANSFKAGMFSLIQGIEQLATGIWGATGGYIWRGATDGDWNWIDSVSDHVNAVTSFNNDNASWLFDSYYVDMDGFQMNDIKDWCIAGSYTLGAMTGAVLTGGAASSLAAKGATLATQGTTAASRFAGKALQAAGNLYARSTGLWKGYIPKEETIRLGAWALSSAHAKTVAVYATKDLFSNIENLERQRIQGAIADYQRDPEHYDPEKWKSNPWETAGYAAGNALMNAAISTIFAGGIDDNQTMRWAELLNKGTSPVAGMKLNNISSFLLKHRVAFNTSADFLDNFLTMYSSAAMGYNQETGSIEWGANADLATATKIAVQAAIQTYPTFKSNIKGRDVAGESLVAVGDAYLKKLVDAEEKATNPDDKAAIRAVRLDYLKNVETKTVEINGEEVTPTPAQRIAYALDQAQGKLQNDTIKKIFDDICNPKTLLIYKEVHDLAVEQFNRYLEVHPDFEKEINIKGSKGIKEFLKRRIRNKWSIQGEVAKYKDALEKTDAFVDSLYDRYLTVTDSKESATILDRLSERVKVTQEAIDEVKESYSGYKYLVQRHKDVADAANIAIGKYAEEYGLQAEDVKAASRFIRLKNDAADRASLNAETAAMVLLERALPHAYYKVDDYTYGIVAMDSEVAKMFNTETAAKFSVAMRGLGTNNPEIIQTSIDLMLSTMVGDEAINNFKRGQFNKAVTKETIETILNTAVDQNVLTKKQAAEALIRFSISDSEIGKQLSTVFETTVNTKNVNNLKNLTPLEKYALIYESIIHLSNPEVKRFSGKTISAEAMLQQGYDEITFEVMKDMEGVLPKTVKEYYLKAYEKQELFPLSTDSILRGLTDAIGKKGLAEFKNTSDVEVYLKSLGTNASDKALSKAAVDLWTCMQTLKAFKSIDFKGDKVTIDLAAWTSSAYRKMIRDVINTDSTARKTKNYEGMTEKEAQLELEVNEKYKGKNITIELVDSNMDSILELYDLLIKAEFIDPEYSKKPTTAEEMKTILSKELSDEGKAFANYKNRTEYDTGIINNKEAAIIKNKLKDFSTQDLIKTVTVIDSRKGSEIKYDYYTILGSNIQTNKISEKMVGLMRRNATLPIYVNPVDIATLGIDSNGVPKFHVYHKEDQNVKTKQGRVASQASSIQRAINSEAEAALVNKDLATTMMLDNYLDYVIENRTNLNILVPSRYTNKLIELGIIGDDGFYKETLTELMFDNSQEKYTRLELKDDVTKQHLEYYLLHDENPNLFKVLPFISNKKAESSSIPFVAPEGHKMSFIPDITGGLTTDLVGMYGVLNIKFDYDQTGKLKEDLITNFFKQAEKGKFEFNPYTKMRRPIKKDTLEEYIAYRIGEKKIDEKTGEEYFVEYPLDKDIDDPFYDLVQTYKDLNEHYIAKDGEANDDYKQWLKNGAVLKRMIDAVDAGKQYTKVFEDSIVKAYKDTTNFDDLVGYTDAGYYYNDISTASRFDTDINLDADTAMSKNLLDASIGIDYQLVDINGMPYEGYSDDIKKAFKYVQDNIEALKDINKIINSPLAGLQNYKLYEATDESNLWSILSAAEGSITIEDLDRLRRIEADAYNNFFAKIGMESGYGAKIKSKVDSMYNKLRSLITSDDAIKKAISTKVYRQTRTQGAMMSEDAKNIAINIRGKKDKQALNRLGQSYMEDVLDTPQITSQRLIDVMSDKADYFNNMVNKEFTERDDYSKAVYNQIAQTQIDDNNDFRRQSLITDISSDINLSKMASTTKNTHESLVNEFQLNPNKEMNQKLIDYSALLTQRMSGTRYLSNYAKYSFLDLESGDEYAMANIQKINGNTSNIDLLLTLFDDTKTNLDWVGKAFITLDKHDGDNPNGLTYHYKVLENETDVMNLKNSVMLEVLKENEYRLNNVEGSTLREKYLSMSNTQQTLFMNKIISEGIGIRNKMDILDNVLAKTNISDRWKYKFLPVDYKGDVNKATIRDIMGTNISALSSSDEGTRKIAQAIIFGIGYDGFDQEHKKLADNFLQLMIDNIEKHNGKDFISRYNSKINDIEYSMAIGNKLTDTMLSNYHKYYGITTDLFKLNKDGMPTDTINKKSSVFQGVRKYVVRNFHNPEVLDYFFNNRRSLLDRYKDYTEGYGDTYKVSTIDGGIKEISVKDIRNFYRGSDTNITKLGYLDTEGSNKIKSTGETADSIRDLFQISLITDELVDGKIVNKQRTYYIKHDIDFAKWVEENIDVNDNFYRDHVDYQKAVEEYSKLIGDEDNILTEQQVFDLLNGKNDTKPDILIAYNGDNYEFRVLKEGLDKDINTMDAMQAVMKRESDTTKSISQDTMYKQYKRNFGDDYSDERHTADSDTRDMHEMLTKDYFESDYAISEDRSLFIKNILNLIPEEYKQDPEVMNKLLTELDKSLNANKNYQPILKNFNKYEPTLDNIKRLQRAYNYMTNNARGNVFFKLREQLGYDTVYGKLVGDNKSKYNFVDVLASKMLETEGDVDKAINFMWANYRDDILNKKEQPSTQDFVEKLMTKDPETLRVLGIDESALSQKETQDYKKDLLGQFRRGLKGFDNGEVLGISKTLARDFRQTEYLSSYISTVETMALQNKDLLDPDSFNIFTEGFAKNVISVSEDFNINDIGNWRSSSIEYNDSGTKALALEIKNLINKNIGTGTFRGLYSMMGSVDPESNENVIEIDPTTMMPKGTLTDVKAGDIVITTKALKEFLNVYDINELAAYNEDGSIAGYYLLSVTNPADNMNSILPMRVRIIDDNEHITVGFTPETQEILRNRDFDGDHTITTVLPKGMKYIAPLFNDYIFNTYTAYSKIARSLSKQDTNNVSLSNAYVQKIGSNKDVIAIGLQLDDILSKNLGKELTTATETRIKKLNEKMYKAIEKSEEFKNAAMRLGLLTKDEKTNFIKKCVETLGVTKTFTNTSDVIRYVNNPALFNYKKIDGSNTFTHDMRKSLFSRQTLVGSNLLDSTIGWYQKLLSSKDMATKEVVNPLQDLYTPSIYLTESLSDNITAEVKDYNSFINYMTTVYDSVASEVTTDKFDTAEDFKAYIDLLRGFAIAEGSDLDKDYYAERAKVLTMEALWDLELYSKKDDNVNKKFLKAMDYIAEDDTFSNQLKVTNELDGMLQQLSGRVNSLSSKKNSYTPLADMLLENTIDRVISSEPEDAHIILKDDISNGANKVNIFITKGFLGNAPDDIAQTTTSKASAAAFDLLDTTEINYDKNILKTNTPITKGTVIGSRIKNGKHEVVKAPYDLYVNGYYGDYILVNYKNELKGKKIGGQGLFKGIVSERKTLKGNGAENIDFIVDANNSTKNFNKYSQGLDLATLWQNAEEATFQDAKGVTYEGIIIKDVPMNIIGDDLAYTQKLGLNDPSNIRRFEVMASDGAYSLLGLGRYGSTVLKGNSTDGFYVDFSEISKALKQNQGNHDVAWADAGSMIMYLRSAALVNAMTEEEFMGLMNTHNIKGFNSRQDYLNNLRTSPEKINSQAALKDQNIMIRSLGLDRYVDLYKASPLMSYIFGSDVNGKLNPTEPSTFSKEFYKDPKSPHSNASGKVEMSKSGIRSAGTYISQSSKDVNDRNLIQSSYLHIPYDQFYRGVTGRYLNQDDMIRALMNGVIGYTKHFKDSAMISNDFTPVDINMGTRLDNRINNNIVSGTLKTSIPGISDIFRPTDTTMTPFQRGSGLNDVFFGFEDPTKPTLASMVSKSLDIGHQLSNYDRKTKIGYMLAVAFDQNKNNLERMGILKGKDSVLVNKLTSQFVNDKDRIEYVRIHDNKKVSLADAQRYINEGTKGYMLRKDVKDSIDKHKFSKEEMNSFRKSGVLDSDIEYEKRIKEANREKAIAYKNLVAALESANSDITNSDIKFTWDVSNSTEPYKNRWWTRSGISTDNADQLSVDVGIKNYVAEAEYIKNETMEFLDNLKTSVAKAGTSEFEDFAKYRWLQASAQADPEGYETRAKYVGADKVKDSATLKQAHDEFVKNNPNVVKAYDEYVDRVMALAKEASQVRNEPFDSYYILFAPYVSRNKEVRNNIIKSNVKTMMGLNKYDPISRRNALEQNMMFDFFEGSKRVIDDLSKSIAADNISKALTGEYHVDNTGKHVSIIDNKEILNKAFEIIDDPETFMDLKTYNYEFDSEISKEVLNVISLYTDIDTYRLRKNSKNGNELLKNAFASVRYMTEELRGQFEEEFGEPATLTTVYARANDNMTNTSNRMLAKETADAMWAEIVVAQRIIETSSKASDKLVKYVASLENSGYVLVNKFGQKIKRNGEIAPISDASLSYLKDNVELTMNSRSETMFAQYVLEKALSGEIYLCRQDLADQLEDKVYTSKIPGRVRKLLTDISKKSAGLQMASPFKMIGRLLRFTGFDYALGAVSNYETIPNMGKAAKELSAALQSNGKTIKPGTNLYEYLIRQGQPSLGGLPFTKKSHSSGLDPINFADPMGDGVIENFTSGMTKPLEFQNHLGRYALFLTAKESFDNGKPWYGSQYYNHEYIDKLSNNSDKAMYVMDYMLGSNGGFPYLSKKTSGLMMYSTFPLNMTRTFGAYGMSVAKLFQEGITSENANQWFNTVIMPSVGMVGISVLSNVILSAICEAYGVDEETEEEWKKEGVTLDPIGTLIGGTPSVVYDPINPAYQFKEMFINPFTNEYNDTLPKKGYGWIKANILSRLNPAIKTPIELVTGKDLWGDSAEGYKNSQGLLESTNKYQYTNVENGMKKVLGYFVGSGVANNIIDQRRIDELNDESNFLHTLWKGVTKGVSADLGNQKSWKKDTSNYYSFITDIKTYNKQTKGTNNFNYLDIEEMSDADALEYNRYYASRYGEFDEKDYNRVSATLKKYIHSHESEATIYAYIVKEYNENNVSEATMRAALNNNSLARKIKQLDNYSEYFDTLSVDEKIRLQKALEYEQEHYPMLETLFPEKESGSTYVPYYKWSGYSGGNSNYSNYSYPKKFNYYPGKYYPKTFYYNKKTGKYGPDIDRVSVNVSPQMAIWNQDYNLTRYDTGYQAENEPKWLRDKGYVNRTN